MIASMIDGRDIWRLAKLTLKTHGENAEIIAAQHIDERLAICSGVTSGGRSLRRSRNQRGSGLVRVSG